MFKYCLLVTAVVCGSVLLWRVACYFSERRRVRLVRLALTEAMLSTVGLRVVRNRKDIALPDGMTGDQVMWKELVEAYGYKVGFITDAKIDDHQ